MIMNGAKMQDSDWPKPMAVIGPNPGLYKQSAQAHSVSGLGDALWCCLL